MTDNEIEKIVGKYQEALSDLCGVDYAYMQGDRAVEAIAELIRLYAEQINIIDTQKAEIERLKEDKETFYKWKFLADRTKEYYDRLFHDAKDAVRDNAIKDFAERLKPLYKTLCVNESDWLFELDNLVKEMVGDV